MPDDDDLSLIIFLAREDSASGTGLLSILGCRVRCTIDTMDH